MQQNPYRRIISMNPFDNRRDDFLKCSRCGKIHIGEPCRINIINQDDPLNMRCSRCGKIHIGEPCRINIINQDDPLNMRCSRCGKIHIGELCLDLSGSSISRSFCPRCHRKHGPREPCPNTVPCGVCNGIGCKKCDHSGIGAFFW